MFSASCREDHTCAEASGPLAVGKRGPVKLGSTSIPYQTLGQSVGINYFSEVN
jgi:hypothetical protein